MFRAHHPALLRYAIAHLRDRSAAEDVVHDVFLRLWLGRANLDLTGSLRAYLVTAVRNRIIDMTRTQAVRQRAMESAVLDVTHRRPTASEADPAEVAELDVAIRTAIADLPERCRTAFLLCREQDLTYAEAAAVMGVAPATVKTQVARALAALRNALAPFLSIAALLTSNLS